MVTEKMARKFLVLVALAIVVAIAKAGVNWMADEDGYSSKALLVVAAAAFGAAVVVVSQIILAHWNEFSAKDEEVPSVWYNWLVR